MRTGWCWPIKGDIGRAREELSESAQQKLCNTLDMGSLRKHVDGTDPLERVSRISELTRVGSESCGVAGDVDDPLRPRFDDAPYHLLRQACSRGIDHQHIGASRLLHQRAHGGADVARVEARVVDAVELGV